MSKAYNVREIDRRCEELAAREAAKRAGYSSEVTVRWVEPRTDLPKRRRQRSTGFKLKKGS